LVLACDWIVASTEARFADTHARVGLLPGWGGSVRLVERVGLARAKEMALTARFLSAQEALAWGLVNHVVAPQEVLPRVKTMAQDLIKSDPVHVRRYKALLERVAECSPLDALAHERQVSIEINQRTTKDDILSRLRRFIR
jgi:enoyl-CoA hydratase